jgi:hypothetical protein
MIESINTPFTADTEGKLVVWSKEIARAVTEYAHNIKSREDYPTEWGSAESSMSMRRDAGTERHHDPLK